VDCGQSVAPVTVWSFMFDVALLPLSVCVLRVCIWYTVRDVMCTVGSRCMSSRNLE
jgi:hypothetical protein